MSEAETLEERAGAVGLYIPDDKTVYLAGAWERRKELRGYAVHLQFLGYSISSRWLWMGPEDGDPTETQKRLLAEMDLSDVGEADMLLLFTGEPGRGGAQVEFGFALSLNSVYTIVIGPVENIFHLQAGEHHAHWGEFVQSLVDSGAPEPEPEDS